MFKTALERMPSDTHKFVIRADCTPTGEHVRRFNAPTVNDVAAILLAIQLNHETLSFKKQYHASCKRDTSFVRCVTISIIYWQGQDGYDITLKMVDPITEYWTTDDSPINLYRKPTPHARIRSRRYDVRAKLWNSDLFTVTCNPKWTEIERELEPGQNRKIAMT
ncbi:hypothetical protein EVAR_20575_1 [Eumeta japonica]|uniref:Uncharacterized protein n=1 Tax=Eumeta variegata TaxID=151549 RepID=A0A4C1URV9_EUMVA|nr:hypothetical protein EVAR_20575_1 [Eumeta japonica]